MRRADCLHKLPSGRRLIRRALLALALVLLLTLSAAALAAPSPLNPPILQAGETIRVTGRPMAGLSQYTLKKHQYDSVLVLIPADAQAWLKLQQAIDSAAFVELTVLVRDSGGTTHLSVQDVDFGPYPADDPATAPRNPNLTTPGDLVSVTGRVSKQEGRLVLTDHRYGGNTLVLHPTAVLPSGALEQAVRSLQVVAVTAVVAPSTTARQVDLLVRQVQFDTGPATTPATPPNSAAPAISATPPNSAAPAISAVPADEPTGGVPPPFRVSDSFWRWLFSLQWPQLAIQSRLLPWALLLLLLVPLSIAAGWLLRRWLPRLSRPRPRPQDRPNVLPVLTGGSEEELYQILLQLTRGLPVTVVPKMRLQDAISVSAMRLPRRLKEYGLGAHLAFTVVDGSTYLPLVAIELEGKEHAARRDQWKGEICARAGLPLIRVRYGRWADLERLRRYLPASPHQEAAAARQPEPPR